MSFGNPILGGNGTLVRYQMKSENYVPGVSGWIIRRDGTFELDGGTFRGDVIVTDPDGSIIEILTGDGGRIRFTPETIPGITYPETGVVSSGFSGGTGNGYAYLVLASPEVDDGGTLFQPGSLILAGEQTNGLPFPPFSQVGTYLGWNGNASINQELVVGGRIFGTDGITYQKGKSGKFTFSIAASTSFTQVVTYTTPFIAGTDVVANVTMQLGAAAGQLWTLRLGTVDETSMTVLGIRAGGVAVALTNAVLHWTAFALQD